MAFPGTYNFNYYRGDTFEFIVNPKDASGAPFSLTGFEGEMTIANKRGQDDDINLYFGTVEKNDIGGLVCTIPPTIGRELSSGIAWQYDIQIASDTEIFTLLTGTITVTEDVTGANPQLDIGDS
jgi:hypothetical protein